MPGWTLSRLPIEPSSHKKLTRSVEPMRAIRAGTAQDAKVSDSRWAHEYRRLALSLVTTPDSATGKF